MIKRVFLIVAILIATMSLFVVQPALAQNPVWRAEFYNNPTLNGSPVVVRNDPEIAFNWGLGSPVAGVDADNFSVRWSTDVQLNPGTYRFWARADDHIRVIFDFNTWAPVINTFGGGHVGELMSGDVTVERAGTYHIQVDYREASLDAYAFVSFANLATNPTGPTFANPVNLPVGGSPWTVQYYANPYLTGDPAGILSVATPSYDWGTGSPLPSVPVDNWSARYTSVQNLEAGAYQMSVRADDGVRVYVNGVLMINEWHAASGQTYTVALNLPAGASTFIVEYYEASGNAFLDFQLVRPGAVVQPTQVPTGPLATVVAYRLNVRHLPDPIEGRVLTRVNRNEQYQVLGRNSDFTWFQINANGTIGWVSARFVTVQNGASLPVITPDAQGGGQAPVNTGLIVTATPYTVNIRSGPGTENSRLARLPAGQTAEIIGRTANNLWWQINYNGIVGWVVAEYAVIQPGVNVNSIPVTG